MPDARPEPPVAPRRPHRLAAHGDVRTDDWYWLADRDDPAVLEYLRAENAYAEAVLEPIAALQEELYGAIRDRVVETDVSAPWRQGEWWWWTRTVEGLQYEIVCRRRDAGRALDAPTVLAQARDDEAPGETVLDENELAGDSDSFALGVLDVSPDQQVVAYAVDLDGSEKYELRFRRLGEPGGDLPDVVAEVTYGSAWAADNRHFFYVRPDEALRPHQVWRHRLGSDPADDELVFDEPDERFFVSVSLSRSQRRILIHSESKTTGEASWVDASDPVQAPRVILARREGVEYDVEDAGDGTWLVRSNLAGPDGGARTNFALYRLAEGDGPDALEVLLPHRADVKVEAVDAFADHLVVTERADGLARLRVIRRADGDEHLVALPDPVYTVGLGATPEWESPTVRLWYTSLTRPWSSFDYDLEARSLDLVRQTPVRGRFDPLDWSSERIWASADDGTRIPISVVRPRDQPLDGSAPLLLYGYGSYEVSIDPTFSVTRLNLLERGVAFAIAHVRGGGELGRAWYEQGRLEHKANTFGDFVRCAEHLIAGGWTAPDRLAIRGGSAGGLLMGAVLNMRPELFRVAVAEVPFVDVVTTMSDATLPLTVTERDEWGDPVADPEAYRRMLAYSPYDNVGDRPYPALYVTAGLNDPRVGYWEPAKWVAKLRATARRADLIVLRTELDAGHQGPSGRYSAWRDEARVQAFVLSQLGRG